MRADARQNRERILGVARTALESEQSPTMVEVARAAGVGQGTLYRNFPTWEDLVIAVHRSDLADLVATAPVLLQQHEPIDALRIWLERLAEYGRIKKGLSGAMHAAMHDQLASEGYAPIVQAMDKLLQAGATNSTIRREVSGEDLLLLVGFLWRLDLTDARSTRLLSLVLHGLRPDAA